MENIKTSGYFRYSREITLFHEEKGDASRLTGIALSQGGLQTILKTQPDLIEKDWKRFMDAITAIYQNREFSMGFCYRMRIGIK